MAASLVGGSSCGAALASRRTWSSKAIPVSGIASCSFSTVRLTHGSPALRVPSSHESVQLNISRSGGSVHGTSRASASNAVSSISIAETDLKEAVEVPVQKAAEEEENPAEELTEASSCPLPDFSTSGTHVALLNPLRIAPRVHTGCERISQAL